MELDPLSRTALTPFWARAQDARSQRPVLGDDTAAALAPQVREWFGEIPLDRSTRVGCCLRNVITDGWLAELEDADTAIVEIGVGLNTRVHRLPLAARTYVEVDCDQITSLRRDLVPAAGAMRVAGDGMDITCWADAIDSRSVGRLIVTLEGVLAYQPPAAVERFFTEAADRFPGAFVVFDRLSPSAAARANRPEARADGRPEYRWQQGKQGSRKLDPLVRVIRAQGFLDVPRGLRMHLPIRDRVVHALPPRRAGYQLVLCQLMPTSGRR